MGRFISREKEFRYSDTVSVKYKQQSAKQDRRHLLIVFSGFCPIGRYNFDGAVADGCRMDILWINDEFNGNNSYYLCQSMNFEVESAVSSLIEHEMHRLDIDRDNCTFLGYSKGGTAALYFGIKHNIRNIIASAPQMHIGSFARENFSSSFTHMTTEESARDSALLDSILPKALNEDNSRCKNIYLISSSQDQFHISEVSPYLSSFENYENFNLIMTESPLVDEHKVLGAYNTPIILAIVYALGEGCTPVFGNAVNGIARLPSDQQLAERYHFDASLKEEFVVSLDRISIIGDRIYPEGVAFIRGVPQSSYNLRRIVFVLTSDEGEFSFLMGTSMDKTISSRYFDRYYCDYSFAGYKSVASEGISLHSLPAGRYQASLRVTIGSLEKNIQVSSAVKHSLSELSNTGYLHWESSPSGSRLIKRPVIGPQSADAYFNLSLFEAREDKIFIEGVFALPHVDSSEYDRKRYSLVLVSDDHTETFYLAQGNRPKLDGLFEGYGRHSKSLFTTPKYAGISLGHLEDGLYGAFVCFLHNDSMVTCSLGQELSVTDRRLEVVN